ncbi:aspartyl-trna synthetase [Tubulinosema ratisbonensis]|uniref:Probable aspartate--tRNA ligase, cytoplasmic n=1 Tax=Tubulinosema ratisbonensis TaxID=291195 RepID=A0A437ANB9_9MICR|nr:aspartyl-trna synthetase [Tubulinosema ratisbonensis]
MDNSLENLSLNTFIELSDIPSTKLTKIYTKGFMFDSRIAGKRGFLILRSGLHTLQCTFSRAEKDSYHLSVEEFSEIKKISKESFLEVYGVLQETPFEIKSCSVKNKELVIKKVVVKSSSLEMPFNLLDASKGKESEFANVNLDLSIKNRWLDLRTPHSQSIFRVIDCLMFNFRRFLREKHFLEIKTPKLIGTASEGGANCFQVKYFKKDAYLAQSPQLYKQMAVIGGLKRVYEIGHVYRAEESNPNRYLSEFVGLDLEMEINSSYDEVIQLIYDLIHFIFKKIEEECKEELQFIKNYKEFDLPVLEDSPVIYTYEECVNFLKEENILVNPLEDFNKSQEKELGKIIKNKRGVDLFVIKNYPTQVRAFYTKACDENPTFSKSYDFILRGEEVLSGAQRIHDYFELVESVKRAGINPATLEGYLNSFKSGVPIHGGCGIGLERLIKSYFGFDNIKYFSMFPRDPTTLYP